MKENCPIVIFRERKGPVLTRWLVPEWSPWSDGQKPLETLMRDSVDFHVLQCIYTSPKLLHYINKPTGVGKGSVR